jgi:hypothetical protein
MIFGASCRIHRARDFPAPRGSPSSQVRPEPALRLRGISDRRRERECPRRHFALMPPPSFNRPLTRWAMVWKVIEHVVRVAQAGQFHASSAHSAFASCCPRKLRSINGKWPSASLWRVRIKKSCKTRMMLLQKSTYNTERDTAMGIETQMIWNCTNGLHAKRRPLKARELA